MENMSEVNERKLFEKYGVDTKCPKCRGSSVVIKTDNGYFWVCECSKCGYKK